MVDSDSAVYSMLAIQSALDASMHVGFAGVGGAQLSSRPGTSRSRTTARAAASRAPRAPGDRRRRGARVSRSKRRLLRRPAASLR